MNIYYALNIHSSMTLNDSFILCKYPEQIAEIKRKFHYAVGRDEEWLSFWDEVKDNYILLDDYSDEVYIFDTEIKGLKVIAGESGTAYLIYDDINKITERF